MKDKKINHKIPINKKKEKLFIKIWQIFNQIMISINCNFQMISRVKYKLTIQINQNKNKLHFLSYFRANIQR